MMTRVNTKVNTFLPIFPDAPKVSIGLTLIRSQESP